MRASSRWLRRNGDDRQREIVLFGDRAHHRPALRVEHVHFVVQLPVADDAGGFREAAVLRGVERAHGLRAVGDDGVGHVEMDDRDTAPAHAFENALCVTVYVAAGNFRCHGSEGL